MAQSLIVGLSQHSVMNCRAPRTKLISSDLFHTKIQNITIEFLRRHYIHAFSISLPRTPKAQMIWFCFVIRGFLTLLIFEFLRWVFLVSCIPYYFALYYSYSDCLYPRVTQKSKFLAEMFPLFLEVCMIHYALCRPNYRNPIRYFTFLCLYPEC